MKYTQAILLLAVLVGCAFADDDENIVLNSDFSHNDCKYDYCQYNQKTYLGNCVQGWLPDDEIEIGYGSIYSDYLSNQRVLKLSPSHNSCVKQFIPNLQGGSYDLQFTWGPKKGTSFDGCQIQAHLNGKAVGKYKPNSYELHTQNVKIDLDQGCEYAELKLCGAGDAWIKVIKLIKKKYGSLTFEKSPPVTYDHIKNIVKIDPINVVTKYISPIVLIDSHSEFCYKRQYQLQAGWHEISFNYRAIFSGYVHESNLTVVFNGQVIGVIFPKDCQPHDYVFQVHVPSNGNYVLQFCPSGCNGQVTHKIVLKDIACTFRPCLAKQFENIIVNGDFEQNLCPAGSSFCIWNNATIPLNGVKGWIPTPQIQIGRGNIYNSVLGTSRVLELDPNANTCVRQQIVLKSGRHSLKFDWAARQGVIFESNQFFVKVNGQVVKSIHPSDYALHQQDQVDFTLNYPPALSEIAFCGAGSSDSFGALIDNVKLFFLDECKLVPVTGGLPFPNVPQLPPFPKPLPIPGWPQKPTYPKW